MSSETIEAKPAIPLYKGGDCLIGTDMPAEYDTKTTKWGTPLPW